MLSLLMIVADTTVVYQYEWEGNTVKHVIIKPSPVEYIFEFHAIEIYDSLGRLLWTSADNDLDDYGIPSIWMLDLDGDNRKELLIQYFTAGAHCCFIYQILKQEKGKPYVVQVIRTRDYPLDSTNIIDLDGDGKYEIAFGDMSFAYAFTSFVNSPVPYVVLTYSPKWKKWVCSRYLTRIYNLARIEEDFSYHYEKSEELAMGGIKSRLLEGVIRLIYAGEWQWARRVFYNNWQGEYNVNKAWREVKNQVKKARWYKCAYIKG